MPTLDPGEILGGPQSIAGDIALVEAHDLGFDNLDESRAIPDWHPLRCKMPEPRSRGFFSIPSRTAAATASATSAR